MTNPKNLEAGQIIEVRMLDYKSFRHYGGREITTTANTGKATFIEYQSDHTYVVTLNEKIGSYEAGRKIAIQPNNIL